MAVSIKQLADALRVDNPDDVEVNDVLTHWLQAAREVITSRAPLAPLAPVAVSDAAIIRLAGFWYDQPTTARGSGYANAMTNSGALAMLGQWVVRRTAGAAEDALRDT